MKFSLEIECNNAAFDEGNLTYEIARILHVVAEKLNNGILHHPIYDINGNKVGFFHLETED